MYFSAGYSPHDHRFLSALSKTEHTVFYVRLEGETRSSESRPVPPRIEQVQWAGGRSRFRWSDTPHLALDFRRLVRAMRPDLVHAGPIQTCAFIAVLSGFRPILTMSWGFDLMQDADRNPWWRWVTSYTLRRSTYFTSDAYVTKDRAVALGMDPTCTVVFPWGVDLQLFTTAPGAPAHSLGARRVRPTREASVIGGKRAFTLFCNRSWEPRYGVDVLAHAFVKASKQNPRLSLILLGGGSQSQAIREILEEGGALGNVHLGGYVTQTDLPRWYHMADLFVSPSHVDGSSVSLMEALACGVPALVSDIPANREWIRPGVNGWLFRDGDIDGLARQILALADQRRLLAKCGRSARASAEQRANWNSNFQVLLQAYQNTIKCS